MPTPPGRHRPCTISPYRNGPYLVRGAFTLIDERGHEVEVRRRTVALCRCGRSRIQPFCDGTHKLIGFSAPSTASPRDQPGGGARVTGSPPG